MEGRNISIRVSVQVENKSTAKSTLGLVVVLLQIHTKTHIHT